MSNPQDREFCARGALGALGPYLRVPVMDQTAFYMTASTESIGWVLNLLKLAHVSNLIPRGSVRTGCLLVYDTEMARIKGGPQARS
jgi:hypothetical protein